MTSLEIIVGIAIIILLVLSVCLDTDEAPAFKFIIIALIIMLTAIFTNCSKDYIPAMEVYKGNTKLEYKGYYDGDTFIKTDSVVVLINKEIKQ